MESEHTHESTFSFMDFDGSGAVGKPEFIRGNATIKSAMRNSGV